MKHLKKVLYYMAICLSICAMTLSVTGCEGIASTIRKVKNSLSILIGEKEVPVYQGMSITQVATTAEAASYTSVSYELATPCGIENGNKNNNGNHNGWYKGDHSNKNDDIDEENPFPDNSENENIENEIENSLNIVGADKEIYYANVGEDIYINIYISNPDDFEIQSFTLNGTKYANYMFEKGSTMETIILKYNVGLESGVKEYTIDAIKYIDGETIKDVIIGGEKTVRAGVRCDDQVTANLTDIEIGTNDFAFNVNIEDKDGLIAFSKGELKAVLYDGENLVATKDLTLGENKVSFDSLKTNGLYQFAIIGCYDNFSGNGCAWNVIYKYAFYTDAIVLFDNVSVLQDGVEFSLLWKEEFANSSLTTLKLYKAAELVKELAVTETRVEGLLSVTEYILIGEYKNGENLESISLAFATRSNAIPTLALSITETGKNTISFLITENDEKNFGEISEIQIVGGEGNIVADSVNNREFSNLLPNTEYTIQVKYVYNLNDGLGEQMVVYKSESVYTQIEQDYLDYEIAQDGVTITGLKDKSIVNVVLPETIQGVPVVKIADFVFSQIALLQTVEIPATITYFGEFAFYASKNLTEVNYLGSIEQWCKIQFGNPYSPYYQMYSMTANPLFNGANLYINGEKVTELIIPSEIIEIKSLFSGCTSLVKVTIPLGVTALSDSVFYGCSNLESIELPSSVISIGYMAFQGCSSLKKIELPANLKSIGGNAFMDCVNLESIEIPSNVVFIDIDAFSRCENLKSVNFEKNSQLTSIGKYAFMDCSSLESIEIPAKVTTLGERSFEGCDNLMRVTFAEHSQLTSIEYGVFFGCSSLESIEIPAKVITLGERSFEGCYNLMSVVIPDSVTTIGDSAFNWWGNLKSVYYKGTATDWAALQVEVAGATVYFYVENEIDVPTDGGNYWHYDNNGAPVIW